MTTNTSNKNTAVTAGLVLIPIVIVTGVAFAAIKCTKIWERTSTKFKNWSASSPRCLNLLGKKKTVRSHTLKRNNDSFGDLESLTQLDKFVGQENAQQPAPATPERVWHPNRSSRLAWSFTSPRTRKPILCESSNLQRPNPTAVRPGLYHEVWEH